MALGAVVAAGSALGTWLLGSLVCDLVQGEPATSTVHRRKPGAIRSSVAYSAATAATIGPMLSLTNSNASGSISVNNSGPIVTVTNFASPMILAGPATVGTTCFVGATLGGLFGLAGLAMAT